MYKVERKLPVLYHISDYKDLVLAKEDVFFEENGQLFHQFLKGQPIPREVYDLIFIESKEEKVEPEVKEEISIEEVKEEEVVIEVEKVEEKTKEVKQPMSRLNNKKPIKK